MIAQAEVVEQATALGDDLLRRLTDLRGDPDAVATELRRWLETIGGRSLGLVCAAAIQTTFAHCLTDVPRPDVPPGSVEFTTPERTPAA